MTSMDITLWGSNAFTLVRRLTRLWFYFF